MTIPKYERTRNHIWVGKGQSRNWHKWSIYHIRSNEITLTQPYKWISPAFILVIQVNLGMIESESEVVYMSFQSHNLKSQNVIARPF